MARAVTVTLSGPFFRPGSLQLFRNGLVDGLVSLTGEWKGGIESRLKPGKGLRTGAYRQGFSTPAPEGSLSAGSRVENSAREYGRFVEHGTRYMKGQNQVRNAKRSIERALKNPNSKAGRKVIDRAMDALT